jgi:hypothetical protein
MSSNTQFGKVSAVHIDIIETSPSLARLEDNWNAVYDADDEAQIFLSWKWLSGWLSSIPGPWFILAAKERDDADLPYVAFFPLRLQTTIEKSDVFRRQSGWQAISAPTIPASICKPEAEHKVIPAFARTVRQMNWARLHLDNVRISERRWRLLTACFPKASFHSTKVDKIIKIDGIDNSLCPYATLPKDWNDYLDALSTNTRQKIRRLLKQVEASSEYRITVATSETFRSGPQDPAGILGTKWRARKADRMDSLIRSNGSHADAQFPVRSGVPADVLAWRAAGRGAGDPGGAAQGGRSRFT